jgi:hypothetical protein
MRNLFRWMAGLAGIAALAKLFGARPRTVPALTQGEPDDDDPAAELRRKLAEARSSAPETAAQETVTAVPADLPAHSPDEPERSLEERRAEIHARAQDAIAAMRNEDG